MMVFLHEPGAGIALFVQQCQHQYYWQREVLSTSNGPIPQNCCHSHVFYWQEARLPFDISVHKPIILSSIVLDLCHVCAISGWALIRQSMEVGRPENTFEMELFTFRLCSRLSSKPQFHSCENVP